MACWRNYGDEYSFHLVWLWGCGLVVVEFLQAVPLYIFAERREQAEHGEAENGEDDKGEVVFDCGDDVLHVSKVSVEG